MGGEQENEYCSQTLNCTQVRPNYYIITSYKCSWFCARTCITPSLKFGYNRVSKRALYMDIAVSLFHKRDALTIWDYGRTLYQFHLFIKRKTLDNTVTIIPCSSAFIEVIYGFKVNLTNRCISCHGILWNVSAIYPPWHVFNWN